jgi:uncharacterized zinc-type alcohol dehydrogenase-like protein
MVRDDWGGSTFPLVPGHEIVGKVNRIGDAVTKFELGQTVAVGCMVDSCQSCESCHTNEEQYCDHFVPTYGGIDRIDGTATQGGYSKTIVVKESFVLNVPPSLDLSRAAPLLCAGITTYSPLRQWQVGPGSQVAIIGMGGLGHMAIKLAVGLGANVTVISRSNNKREDAFELGAHTFLVSSDDIAMASASNEFDLILDTVPVKHDINPYIPLLKRDATLVLVGQVGPVDSVSTVPMIFGRRRIAGSLIGGIAETQELLDFCARMDIHPECELIRMDEINTAFERMENADVKYRFVIDMGTLTTPE